MRTLNYVVLVLVLASFGFVSFGCGDSDSPTAPSVMQDAPSVRSTAPSTPVRAMPASFDPDGLRHDIRDGFNAYEFSASYDGSMLTLTLTEDEMSGMREASKPHRNRTITVEICPSEPKLATLACGDQIWRGSLMLSGTVELDPIPLASCDGWITVTAAELSDDRNDGWRNAPCPMPNGDPVGSDGTGDVWPDYRDSDEYDPGDSRANLPGQIQASVNRVIEDAGGLRQGGRTVQVPYGILFEETPDHRTIRVSTDPPNIVGTTVRTTGIDIIPERPGPAVVTVKGSPSLEEAFNVEVEARRRTGGTTTGGTTTGGTTTGGTFLTACVTIHWTEPDNFGFGSTYFYYDVENTCGRSIRVYWAENNDDFGGWNAAEFIGTRSRTIGPRTRVSYKIEGSTNIFNRFFVRRDRSDNQVQPQVRYCANDATPSGTSDDNPCRTDSPRGSRPRDTHRSEVSASPRQGAVRPWP